MRRRDCRAAGMARRSKVFVVETFSTCQKRTRPRWGRAPDRQRDRHRRYPFGLAIISKFLYSEHSNHTYIDPSLYERTRPTESGRIRLAIGESEGISLKGRGREILLRHEGLAPVRLSIGLETGSGSFQADVFLPDVGSIALSSSLDPRAFGSWMPTVPFSPNEAPRPPGSDGTGAQAAATRKGRQPFTSLEKARGTRNEDQRNDTETRANGQRRRGPRGLIQGGKGRKKKKALGVGVIR